MPTNPNYFQKNGENLHLATDLSWNFPEQKYGNLLVVGGNKSSFATEIKVAEYLTKHFPFLSKVQNLFPDSVKPNLPNLPHFPFFESTESGSFAKSSVFLSAGQTSEKTGHFSLLLGDFSKNSETAVSVVDFIKNCTTPLLLTRDTLDLISADAETVFQKSQLFIVGSLVQLQKLFRALYYPKMLLLSQPLLPVVETLHKFTLSYPVAILTFHDGQVLCAHNGQIISVSLDKTLYSPISLWSGEVAAKIAIFSLFNPQRPLDCLVAGLTYK